MNISASDIGIPTIQGNSSTLNNIFAMIFVALAAVCIFFIVRGALLYVTSGSNPADNKQARETILYAIVALVGSTMVLTLIWFIIRGVGGQPNS